jgi:protein subunit release factor A
MTRVSDTSSDAPRPELGDVLSSLRARLDAAKLYLRLDDSIERLAVLEEAIAEPDLWADADRARKVNSDYGRVRDDVESLRELDGRLGDAEAIHAMALEEGGGELPELTGELNETAAIVAKALD